MIKVSFFQKIVLPALLAILLFIVSIYAFIIPRFEKNAIEQKKIMLNELTNTAWSILKKYNNDEKNGILLLEEAQKKAISEIEALRYGTDKKDYFWITDLKPTMIMHPYVHELNGKSLHDYADTDGKKIFLEAVKIANEKGEGFISYKWQLNDDTTHIVPKLSFVKKFTPWDWIIGTGIYLNDVQLEISLLSNKLIFILLGIILIISMIIFFMTFQSLKIEKDRQNAVLQLRESREKYKSLIESSTEGVILLLNSKISYTNSFIQNWLQYSPEELINIDIKSIFATDYMPDFDNIKNETKSEIELINKNGIKSEAILTVLPVKFAEKEGLLLTFRDTSEHKTVKTELEIIKNRIDFLQKHAEIGIFRFSLSGKIRLIEFNNKTVSILGYSDKSDLKNIPLIKLFSNKSDLKKLIADIKNKKSVASKKISLIKKDQTTIDIFLSLYLNTDINGEYNYCDGILITTEKEEYNNTNFSFSHQLSEIFAVNQQNISEISKTAVFCPAEASIARVIEIMKANNTGYVCLLQNNICIGIITQQDIITRASNEGKINETAAAIEFMTAPLITADEKTEITDAAVLIEKNRISFLPLKNSKGIVIGMIEKNDLFGKYFNTDEMLDKLIKKTSNINELKIIRKNTASLIKPLINETGSIQTITKIISGINDKITQKIIQDAIMELGAPPVDFCFITLGSSGREELFLNSDQDNAIIYADSESISTEAIHNYFLNLSEKICLNLNKSGLPLCEGGYMASNPKWCQPLSVWKEYFNEWIVNAEPSNLLNITVFFDFRLVSGSLSLFNRLEDYIFEILQGRTAFFYFLAQTAIGFKPPINVFGNIISDSSAKKSESIDIKHCIATVNMFARIFALNNNIRLKGSIERINALRKMEVISQSTYDEIIFHYNYLMQLRMQQQINQAMSGKEISNYISPKKLSEMDQLILKKVFSQMNSYSERLSASFMSAYKG